MVTKEQQIAFLKSFKDCFRDRLMANDTIRLNGLGEFSLSHIHQKEETKADGQVVMMPPRNQIIFKSEADI